MFQAFFECENLADIEGEPRLTQLNQPLKATMYNNMTERQMQLYASVRDHLSDDNVIDNSLAANMAILMDTIETSNVHVTQNGQVLEQTGTNGQTRYIPNPAVAQRDAAIKQFNVHVRTLKIETQALEGTSELASFLGQ